MSRPTMRRRCAQQFEDQAIKDLEKDIFESEKKGLGGEGTDEAHFVDAKGRRVEVARHSTEIETAQRELEARNKAKKSQTVAVNFVEKLAEQKASATAKEAQKLQQRLEDGQYDDLRWPYQ